MVVVEWTNGSIEEYWQDAFYWGHYIAKRLKKATFDGVDMVKALSQVTRKMTDTKWCFEVGPKLISAYASEKMKELHRDQAGYFVRTSESRAINGRRRYHDTNFDAALNSQV